MLDHIAQESSTFDTVIVRAQREIELLLEYRTCLISDVVTGKLDVRGVELPAMDESDGLDDLEISHETETDNADDVIEDSLESDDADD